MPLIGYENNIFNSPQSDLKSLLDMARVAATDKLNDLPLTCLQYAVIFYNNSDYNTHCFKQFELNFKPPEEKLN